MTHFPSDQYQSPQYQSILLFLHSSGREGRPSIMLNASTLLQDYGLDDVISAVYTPLPLSSVVISDRRRDLQGQGRKVT